MTGHNLNQTSSQLIHEKYQKDGDAVIADYQNLDFHKHIFLMKKYMDLGPGKKVLDLGCGTGRLLIELLQTGAEVTGLDTFEEADGIDRKIVEARLNESGYSAKIIQGSAAKLPFADGAFDLVVSIGMLEHVDPAYRTEMLQEIFRIVRPGGYFFLIAGPTVNTPFDQHIPGHPFPNWLSRERKLAISEQAGRRQFLEVPWGISRKELRNALPGATFTNLYGTYFAIGGGSTGGKFSLNPMELMVWIKRRFHLHKLFGGLARIAYLFGMEHCHILSIRKTANS